MELEATTNIEIITGIIIILITLAVALKFTVKEKSTEIGFTPTSEAATKVQEYEGSKTIDALQAQAHVMERYLNLLRLRAREEGIVIGGQ